MALCLVFLFGYSSCVQINFDSPVKFCQKLEKLHLKSEDETATILPSIWQEHCLPKKKKKALCVWGKVLNIKWRLHKQVYSCLCHQRETNSFVTFRSCSGLRFREFSLHATDSSRALFLTFCITRTFFRQWMLALIITLSNRYLMQTQDTIISVTLAL